MNIFDDAIIDYKSFSYLDLLGQDRWTDWTVAFGALTIVGTPAYTGRYRIVGRSCQFQVQFSAGTSIASVAGTDYLTLPFAAAGLAGMAVMTDTTSNVAVGLCHIDVSTSRCYLPSQVASADVFNLAGWFEV